MQKELPLRKIVTLFSIVIVITALIWTLDTFLNLEPFQVNARVSEFDSTFNLTASEGVTFDIDYDTDYTNVIKKHPDGDYLVAGHEYFYSSGEYYYPFVCKVDESGSLDTSYGNYPQGEGDWGGCALRQSGGDSGQGSQIYDMYVESDGSVVLAGTTQTNSGKRAVIIKFDSTGSIDTAFGDGFCNNPDMSGGEGGSEPGAEMGCTVISAGSSGDTYAYAVDKDSAGNYLVVGRGSNGTNYDLVTWKFDSTGNLVTDYGTGSCTNGVGTEGGYGCTIHDAAGGSSGHERGYSLYVNSDDSIVVAGEAYNGTYEVMSVWKYTSSGALDTGFGSGGSYYFNGELGSNGSSGMAIDYSTLEESYVVTGYYETSTSDDEMTIWKFDSSGSLDAEFGDGTCVGGVGVGGDKGCVIWQDTESWPNSVGTDIVVDDACTSDNQGESWCKHRYVVVGYYGDGYQDEIEGGANIWVYDKDGTLDSEYNGVETFMSTSVNVTDAFNGQTPSIYLEDNGDYVLSGMVYDGFSRDDVFILKMTNAYQISGLDSSFVPYVNERDISTSTSNGVYGDQTVFISSAGGVLFDDLFQINDPAGLMIDSSDNVYVTDYGDSGHLIHQFDVDGNFVENWGSTGTGDGQFDYPVDIARDSEGNIYIADAGNYRIQKFSPDGTFNSAWGSSTFEGGELSNIKGMTIDSNDNMYISQAGEVKKFQTDGTLLDTWSGFANVYGVATDSSNNVYIVDTGLSRVYKYSSDGTYLDEWGSGGSNIGQFSDPYGIGVDSSDYIYVADSANNRIQKFDSSGNFQMQISGAGSEDGVFDTPVDVEVNSNGDIYVLEGGYNDRVQKFDSSGTFIHNWGHEVIRDIDPLAELLVDMRDDRDWSSVTKGISRVDGKSFIHGLPTSEGTYMPFSLFVPKLTDSEGVHVCPGVDSLGNITDECSAGYEVLDGDVRISTITYNGRDYWKVTGVAGSGGMNILAQANTGGDDPVEDPTEDPTEDPGTDPTSEQTDNSDDNSDVELTEAGQPVVLVMIGAGVVLLIAAVFYLYQKGILKMIKKA